MFEHTFTIPAVHQGYLEPSACVVQIGVDGRVGVWPSNKLPYVLRDQLADLIDRPTDDIVIHPTVVGGDFGAKGGPMDVPLASHLARLTGRPIKFVSTAQDDLLTLSHRHPSVVTIRTGLRHDGTIVARHVRIVYNTGAYGALKPSEDGMLTGADYAGGPYEIPNLEVEAFCVYTNQPPCGYMRAPGHPQVAFAVEAHMDLLAREVGLDPLEFRLRNVARRSPTGGEGLAAAVLREAANAIGWQESGPGVGGEGPGSFSATPLVGRGIAIIERGIGFGEGSSDITVNPDGTITVVTGLPDNGTGTLTVVAQVVAEELGVAFERIELVRGTTDALVTDVGSAADRMTNVAGHAAIAACEQVKAQLAPLAASMLGADDVRWDAGGWRSADGRFVSLEELAVEALGSATPEAHVQVTINRPRSLHRSYCAQAAEVEVDPDTGEVHLRRVASSQDTGTIINTLGHQGQIEGGLVQGIGYALMEEMPLEDGRIANPHLGEYKIPTVRDVPELITVNVSSVGPGPFEAGAIGETPCVPTGGAIANAVADAIGGPVLSLPITAEKVLGARLRANLR
ncbi:MAG: molybdopterin-dependent oxidoreductase [Chloroflexi bacterium]|nr:molybdopterin-dependent oxidoreductase [Chloroflexota bacterium]